MGKEEFVTKLTAKELWGLAGYLYTKETTIDGYDYVQYSEEPDDNTHSDGAVILFKSDGTFVVTPGAKTKSFTFSKIIILAIEAQLKEFEDKMEVV